MTTPYHCGKQKPEMKACVILRNDVLRVRRWPRSVIIIILHRAHGPGGIGRGAAFHGVPEDAFEHRD